MIPEFALPLAQSANDSNWVESLKFVGAAVAFGIGLWQYRKAQIWKRVEFVAAEMRTFYDDEAAKAAMFMLDWRRKEMLLYKYRDPSCQDLVDVNYKLVAESLGTDPAAHYNKEQSAIREIFERFLMFLSRFESFIETGVVKKNDLKPYLDYWVRLLSGYDEHSPEVTEIVLPQLWKFIDFYGYEDVLRFVARFEEIRSEFVP